MMKARYSAREITESIQPMLVKENILLESGKWKVENRFEPPKIIEVDKEVLDESIKLQYKEKSLGS